MTEAQAHAVSILMERRNNLQSLLKTMNETRSSIEVKVQGKIIPDHELGVPNMFDWVNVPKELRQMPGLTEEFKLFIKARIDRINKIIEIL